MTMETLRNVRSLGAAFVNSELVYAFLMGMGWFFLIGWLVALAVAYVKAFRGEQPVQWAVISDRRAKPRAKAFPSARHFTAADRT
jgi:hypothetical protein